VGLDVYLYDGNGEGIERDSALHPDNYNKVGYFRSSYNPSGINRKASNLGLPGLYDIFEPGDDYEFAPDWQGSLVRVKEALKQWRAKNEAGCYDAIAVNLHNADNGIQSEVDAIAYFRKHGQGEGAWSSRDMFYVGEGITIYGAVSGRNCIDTPNHYLIIKRDPGELDYYVEMLEIVQETIEWVLAQPEDAGLFTLHWSS